MKNFGIHILIVLLIGLSFSTAYSANLDGHMQYRITSYSFSSDNNSPNSSFTTDLGPLLITGTTLDVLTDDFSNSSDFGSKDLPKTTDVFAFSADYMATPDLSLRTTFGITKNRFDSTFDPNYQTSWEANLGIFYQLFNNIRYEIHFGYMDTGDLFKESSAYTDVESIIMISNKLSMSF